MEDPPLPNHFRFPIVNPYIGDARLVNTYASVTRSILERISGEDLPMVQGKIVCLPQGHFEIILCKAANSGLNGQNHPQRSVRLRFSYPNMYLEAFKSNGVWYRFSNMHPNIIPAGALAHRYQVVPLPFEAGYHRRGLRAKWSALRFGRTTMFDIYRVLRDYPNNVGGLQELAEVLSKTSVVFPEALRFPEVREFIMHRMKFLEGISIDHLSGYFNMWQVICNVIRAGPQNFKPGNAGVEAYDDLLPLVALLLHQ